jgi:hypothetical protein
MCFFEGLCSFSFRSACSMSRISRFFAAGEGRQISLCGIASQIHVGFVEASLFGHDLCARFADLWALDVAVNVG